MPNTLFHIGVNVPATRMLMGPSDAKWVLLGCILPDLAWILRRIVDASGFAVSPYELRSAAIVLSSLFACLVLAAAIAPFSRHSLRTFSALAFGSLLHLLVDATQRKWGNGVDILAPLVWEQWAFGWYWPESVLTLAATLWGLAVAGYLLRRWPASGRDLRWPGGPGMLIAAICFLAWTALVPAFGAKPWLADYHSMRTLASPGAGDERRPVAIDRRPLVIHDGARHVRTFDGGLHPVEGVMIQPPAIVSLRGTLLEDGRIEVEESHRHWGRLRDLPSYAGLVFVLAYWVLALRDGWRSRSGGSAWRGGESDDD